MTTFTKSATACFMLKKVVILECFLYFIIHYRYNNYWYLTLKTIVDTCANSIAISYSDQ